MDDAFAAGGAKPEYDLLKQATNANTFGIIAVILTMMGPCSMYMTYLAALPMGAVAVYYARAVLEEDPDGETTAYARTGLVLGVVSVAFSSLWLLFILGIMLMYGAMFAAIIAGNL